jgi:hypothetical protein
MDDLTQRCPQLLIGLYVAIASCDSGSYTPTDDEVNAGWRRIGVLALSPKVQAVSQLPAPGFDEWYVYDRIQEPAHHTNFVNTWGGPLSSGKENTNAFWDQVIRLNPLHVLGAGSSTLFLVTRDEALFRAITELARADEGAHFRSNFNPLNNEPAVISDDSNAQLPDFNEELANAMIGKRMLVGLTHMNHENETTGVTQFHGEVVRASSRAGIVLRMSNSDVEFALPPDLSQIEPAPPGDYRLRSSGEVVKNPDFLCTYVIYPGSK